MKKIRNLFCGLACLLTTISLVSCGEDKSSSSGTEVENYYVINVSEIRTEMLVNTSITLNPTFTNLGEVSTPKYSVGIKYEDEDKTSFYNAETKTFSPSIIGTYVVTFTVLNDDGTVYMTASGAKFEKTINIEVVTQSFAPRNTEGPDVSVSKDGVITFGSSYSAGSVDKITSNQYKVTGVTFEGSYSITYEMTDLQYDKTYSDPSLYFGWVKDWTENNDDSIKLSTGNGTMAAWVWDKNGDQADLSINRTQGWNKGGWWDAPGSTTDDSPVEGNHTITFERYVNTEKDVAIYGIIFDGKPYTYLNVGENYTNVLTNVWIESNNTSGSIKVKEFKNIEDTKAPTLTLDYNGEYFVNDTINLSSGTKVSDDSVYSSILTPTYQVFDSEGLECPVTSGTFTPAAEGTYTVKAKVNDLAMNEASKETTITIKKEDIKGTIIDLSLTTPVAMPSSGVILYYSAKKDEADAEITSITATLNGTDVTSSTIYTYKAKTVDNMEYTYFKGADKGVYSLTFTAADGTSKVKEITVADTNTTVYGYTYYDLSTLTYKNKFIVGRDLIIYTDNGATDGQTVKLGMGIEKKYDWTISFDITDLSYTSQGKFFITKNTMNSEGNNIGWEDLALGGNCKANGDPDLWGYECNVLGTGWTSYQWRSNWQDVTTEFMPDPTDKTIGCGRGADAYAQYATGTHSYKIVCSTDNDNNVTYTYYIDNAIEVVHHTADAHDGGNGVDFIQLSAEHMNGIITNISVK